MNNNLVVSWEKAAQDLHLDIISPFALILKDNTKLEIEVLLKSFGAKNGMLIISDFNIIKNNIEEIRSLDYGYSTMSIPKNDEYDRQSTIEVLQDWGWSGDPKDKPQWLEE